MDANPSRQSDRSAEQAEASGFTPIIPADQHVAEFTIKAVLLGAVLGVIFGAANVYLALNVGLTVSASIPVAVISMAILRGIFKRGTILENNMVQTIGSAGESLAAGVVFTLPALIIWGHDPSLFFIFTLSLLGGLLGVLFMIPLRKHLIVEEHEKLPYPEGTACAEVLAAGQEGGLKARKVFVGLGLGAIYTFLMKGLGLWPESPSFTSKKLPSVEIGLDNLPALLGVGYIIGPRIAGIMLAGGVMGWLVLIPAIAVFGGQSVDPIFPARKTLIGFMAPGEIWNYYIRYIGAGAVACGGMLSLIKALPTIIRSFKIGLAKFGVSAKKGDVLRTQRDLPGWFVLAGALAVGLLIWIIPFIPVGFLATFLIVLFSFFFVTVSSRIVGLIGSSSNPASGMTIATLLAVTSILAWAGYSGEAGKIAAITAGGIVCIGICIAGDTSQDLKTGFLVGATPWRQQIGEFIGVVVAALFIGLTLFVLNKGYGIGPTPEGLNHQQAQAMIQGEGVFADSAKVTRIWQEQERDLASQNNERMGLDAARYESMSLNDKLNYYLQQGEAESSSKDKRLKAPQATLMAMVIDGVMSANLPWMLIFIGAFAAIVVELLGIPSLPFAVGLYLPLSLSTPIIAGGVVRGLMMHFSKKEKRESVRENGILLSSGLIAGEALIGILLALLAWQKIHLDVAHGWMGAFAPYGSLIMFGLLIGLLIHFQRVKNGS